MEHKFLSAETANALKTIRKIVESFPEYGVVDLFGLYSPKEVILSILALARLQSVVSSQQPKNANVNDNDNSIDGETLDDLAHYVKFAHAAYGWKGLAAFCGRLHLGGDSRALVKRCGIRRSDILMAHWHSRANRPVSGCISLIMECFVCSSLSKQPVMLSFIFDKGFLSSARCQTKDIGTKYTWNHVSSRYIDRSLCKL